MDRSIIRLDNKVVQPNVIPEQDKSVIPKPPEGMTNEEIVELWFKEGAPVIHLADHVNCFDLAELLRGNVRPEYMAVIHSWVRLHDGSSD